MRRVVQRRVLRFSEIQSLDEVVELGVERSCNHIRIGQQVVFVSAPCNPYTPCSPFCEAVRKSSHKRPRRCPYERREIYSQSAFDIEENFLGCAFLVSKELA